MPAFPLGQITQPGQHSVSPSGRSNPGRSNGSPDAALRCKACPRESGGQSHQLGRLIGRDRRLAGLAGFVAQEPLNARFGEVLLPAPHGGPAEADARPRHLFLPLVAVAHDCFQPFPVYRADDHAYTLRHELPPHDDDLTFVSRASRCQKSEKKWRRPEPQILFKIRSVDVKNPSKWLFVRLWSPSVD